MSPSRRDALDRVRHFEQLANGQTFSSNFLEEKQGTTERSRYAIRMNVVDMYFNSDNIFFFQMDIATNRRYSEQNLSI